MKTSVRTFVLGAALVAVAPAMIACGSAGEPGSPQNTSEVATSTAAVAATTAVPTHGPGRMIALALNDTSLQDTQRAQVTALLTSIETKSATFETARRNLDLAIAAQVEAGKIDRVALKPQLDAIDALHQAGGADHDQALQTLHSILTPQQRATFADAVAADMSAHAPPHPPSGAHEHHDHLPPWAADLALTDAQKTQLETAMHAHFEAMRAANGDTARPEFHPPSDGGPTKMLESFKADVFVPNAPPPHPDHAGGMADHKLAFLEALTPILTADQRTTAAQKLRTQENEPPFGGR